MDISELNKLNELYHQAVEIYKSNGKTDYDAGIVEGLKRAVEILEVDPV